LLQRSRIDLDEGSLVKAGSLAKEANAHLERAHALKPDVADYGFGLGLYQYFGAKLPASLQILNWLWFVPSGDAGTGVAYLTTASKEGPLFSADAEATLASISYDEEPKGSTVPLENAGRLAGRFPDDRLFAFEQARLLFELRRYAEASLQARRVIDRPADQLGDRLYRVLSRVWLA